MELSSPTAPPTPAGAPSAEATAHGRGPVVEDGARSRKKHDLGRRASNASPTPSAPKRERAGFAKVVGGLTGVNVVLFMAALLTGPLQAHGLGVRGRGELAEVLVPISLAGVVGEFGLGMFAMREVARGRPSGVLLGTVGTMMVGVGLVGAGLSGVIATLLVGHREPVHRLVEIGFFLLPCALISNLAGGMCAGLERWRAYSIARVIPPLGTVVVMVLLLADGRFTVTTIALASFGLGVVALVPLLTSLRGGGPLRFEPAVARRGLQFGSKAWVGSLLGSTTAQVFQLIMVALVGPAQLGLYVVASNVASSTDLISTSVYGAIFPRVASGDHALAARATRMTILVVSAVGCVVGAISPIAIPLAFGAGFRGSVPMVELLLVSTVLTAAASVLGGALTGAGRPGLLAIGDLIGLVGAAAGLWLLLPVLGGVGAAVVVLGTSSAVFLFLLYWCRRVFALPVREYVVIKRADLGWAGRQLAPILRRLLRPFPSRKR